MCFLQVGIDLIGPLPRTERGNKYIVTLVDYFLKWPEAEALPDKSANSVAQFLYKMMCRYDAMYMSLFNITDSNYIVDMVVVML